MDLQPFDEGGGEAAATDGSAGTTGRAGFRLSPERQQLIGVARETVRRRPLERVLRISGRVAHDPELFEAIEELRQARVPGRAPAGQAEGLAKAVRSKLRLLGLSEGQVEALASREGPPTDLLLAPKGGRAWVYADVFQSELGLVKPGMALEAATSAAPGRRFSGRIQSVDALVNPATRTAKARALVEDPEGDLRADMFLDVKVRVPLGSRLAVPQEAVLETGEEQIAFVLREDRIEPRRVRLGRRAEGFVEVLQGLSEGETVAASSNFLLDSESRLRSAVEAFGNPAGPGHRH